MGSGRGEEGVPSQGTAEWMRCLYCNPQAEIVAAVCSHPSKGSGLRCCSPHCPPAEVCCCAATSGDKAAMQGASKSALGDHALPVRVRKCCEFLHQPTAYPEWPWQLFLHSSGEAGEAQPPCTGCSMMSVRTGLVLQLGLFFMFPTFLLLQLCPCLPGRTNSVPVRKAYKGGGSQG